MEKIKSNIEKLKKGLNNPYVPKEMKAKMKAQIEKLEKELEVKKTPPKKEPTTEDLKKRLTIVRKMAKKDPKLKARVKIIQKMIDKSKKTKTPNNSSVEGKPQTTVKGLKKLKAKQFNQMNDYVYQDVANNRFYFIDFEGDVMEVKNLHYLSEIRKFYNIETPKKLADGGFTNDYKGDEGTTLDSFSIKTPISDEVFLHVLSEHKNADGEKFWNYRTRTKDREWLTSQFRDLNKAKEYFYKQKGYYPNEHFYANGGETWMQSAEKEMEKDGTVGLFTKKAHKAGMTTVGYAKSVLSSPKKHTLKTRREAQFMKNANPELFK